MDEEWMRSGSGVNGCHTLWGMSGPRCQKTPSLEGVRNGEGSPSSGKGYPPLALPQPTMCLGEHRELYILQ